MSNTYKKYCPNVYVACCEDQHERGEEIVVTTRYGKENDCIVHNFVGRDRAGNYLYSITRADGFNTQDHAKRKADRLNGYAANATQRSTDAWEASKEGADFLSLAEPIKVGHHSEKRHRALIERNHRRMDKCVAESKKAEEYANRAEYWEARTNTINLSMPESLDYFAFKLDQAEKEHAKIKAMPAAERPHSFSLTYANKHKKEIAKKLATAKKLWSQPTNA